MQVTRIVSVQELSHLRDEWNELAGGVPFRSWEWMEAWWRHYAVRSPSLVGREQLFTLCVRADDGTLVGLAPLFKQFSPVQGRVLQFLGSGEICSDYQTILCRPGYETKVVRALVQWLTSRQPTLGDWLGGTHSDEWDLLELSGVDASDPVVGLFRQEMERRGCDLAVDNLENCWRVQLPENWEEYVSTLSRSQRRHVRRLQRMYFDKGRCQWHMVKTVAELHAAFDILIDLHQRRHRALGRPGCFTSSRFTAFHREVSMRLLERGELRLHWVSIDDKPVAIEYEFVCEGVVYLYQSGMDPDSLEDSPGRIAAIASLRNAIEQGCTAYDFLRGDESYKTHWGALPRPNVRVRVVPDRAAARLRYNLWRTARGTQKWLQQSLGLVAKAPPTPVDAIYDDENSHADNASAPASSTAKVPTSSETR